MASSGSSSSGQLSAPIQELARTMQLDVEATIRVDMERERPAEALEETLPRLSLAHGKGADLEPLGLIGEGGMGEVRLARQRALGRDVALKMVRSSVSSERVGEFLMQEGVITGRLEHPNIVPVHMMGVDENDRPVIVMKRVEGVAWSHLADDDALFTVWSEDPMLKHLEVFLEVCNAVAFAHDRGYAHRDIKPSNVMVGAFGEVVLLDWGISARLGTGAFAHLAEGQSGMPLGTPLYMAPEMCRTDGVIDERTDVYLLGATLHRVLTGTNRHRGDDLVEVLMAAAKSAPYPYRGEIPEELAEICNRATARRKGDRYASVAELREAVVVYLRHKGSIDLAREGENLLAKLEKQVEVGTDHAEARRLFTECRFAFMRALHDWKENQRAAAGLSRCLEAMARVELDLGQLEAAQALLDEMPDPSRPLQERLDLARRLRVSDEEQVASLRKLQRELDPTVSQKPRAALAVALALLVGGTVTAMSREEPLFAQTPIGALYVMPPFVLVYIIAAIALRKQLFSTLLNRRIMIIVAIGLAAMTINRTVAIAAQPPFAYMLGVDLFLIGVIATVAGATLDRGLYAAGAIWTAGFVGIVLLPDIAMVPYAVSQIGGLLVMAYVFYRRRADDGPVL